MAKTPINRLNEAISGILAQYEGEVAENVGKIAEDIGKQGVKALRRASPRGSGRYARGWKTQVERGRMTTTVTIYNEHPGLPHLLEYGHVTRNGTGRTYPQTPAYEHIKPVETELVETFEKEVMAKL